jgi:hypothetical protein
MRPVGIIQHCPRVGWFKIRKIPSPSIKATILLDEHSELLDRETRVKH